MVLRWSPPKHGHFGLVALVAGLAGLGFLVWAPTLPAVSTSLLLFAGFHALGGLVLVGAVVIARPRLFQRRREAASAGLDFGATVRGPIAFGVAALIALGAATLLLSVAPALWPLSFLLVVQATLFVSGSFTLRAATRPDCAILPGVDFASRDGGRPALVIGCGSGRSTLALAAAGRRGAIVAMDAFAPETRKRLTSNLALGGLADRVDVRDGSPTELSCEDGSFDLIVAAHVYDHLRGAEDQGLGEAARALAPGGRLLITLWTPNWALFTVASLFSQRFATPAQWRQRLAKAGLAITREGVVNSAWFAVVEKRAN